jgi:uncharacterized protein (DUF924 family)
MIITLENATQKSTTRPFRSVHHTSFPHRNEILCRETVPEEAEFLMRPGSSF